MQDTPAHILARIPVPSGTHIGTVDGDRMGMGRLVALV